MIFKKAKIGSLDIKTLCIMVRLIKGKYVCWFHFSYLFVKVTPFESQIAVFQADGRMQSLTVLMSSAQ